MKTLLWAFMALSLFPSYVPLYAKGSSKPKAAAPSVPLPILRRLVAVDEVRTNDVLGGGFDELRFATLLGEQFSHSLVHSKRYVDVPLESDDAQFELDVALIAFEVTSKKGVKFGFNPSKNFLPIGVGFEAQVQHILVTFRLSARDPQTNRIVGSVLSSAQIKDKSSSLMLKYLDFVDIGYNSEKRTPLSRVTEVALRSGVESLSQEVQHVPWESKVLEFAALSDGRSFVRVNVGHDVGLSNDTRLRVLSRSPLEGAFHKADILIYSIGLGDAWGEIQGSAQAPIRAGDRVVLGDVPPSIPPKSSLRKAP